MASADLSQLFEGGLVHQMHISSGFWGGTNKVLSQCQIIAKSSERFVVLLRLPKSTELRGILGWFHLILLKEPP